MPYFSDKNGEVHFIDSTEYSHLLPSGCVEITELEAKQLILSKIPLETYKEKREIAYLSIGEQLDMLYWDRVNGTDNWFKHIQTVKNLIPKI